MLQDFQMIVHKFPDRPDITIIPFADTHIGSPECMEEELIDFLKMVEETPNVYLAILGDLIDNCTRNSIGSVFTQRYRPADQKKLIAKLLEPVRDRVLVATQGNHEARSMKDADDCPLYDIMCKLDLEHLYRENIAFVKIQMGDNRNGEGKRNPTYVLACTHGTGGGMFTGGAVNRNERFGYVLDGVDALVTGHTHKPVVSAPGKLKVDPWRNTVQVVPFKVVTATSWLEYGGYAAKKMLLPATHSLQTMTLRGKKKEIIVTM
jgi:predicted phosphodiesterase